MKLQRTTQFTPTEFPITSKELALSSSAKFSCSASTEGVTFAAFQDQKPAKPQNLLADYLDPEPRLTVTASARTAYFSSSFWLSQIKIWALTRQENISRASPRQVE